mmetsp:Transcript_18541/g.32456  ORF Transcript_18541/g.32456 Transcript_18541/m.32456 type:complete len:256 (-) Transcript_18541:90-857(-)|eukprot:CAMPEP_0197656398 /NCGR_PEP_ID=MMETSP1338-20131121/41693_1 /TAXON_ID=43686 ORGANISM="Pelagodinium beii, Strain RCC1491" /NCGR_SAMPLE_ID=MMETSP1338 /ASSEMBLY_ACC=CAM_ASM_000754 /LENGTH=255 /DNA_ID=CAMNT_0043232385 /DNA_START=129 /DNA_END=896 /DNA_ORIENTATION=-
MTILKIFCQDQIFRIQVPSPGPSSYEDVQAAVKAAVTTPFRMRYAKDERTSYLEEETFDDFLSTASRSGDKLLLRIEVEVEKEASLTPAPIPDVWQEDPRDLDELVSQFSDEEVKLEASRRGRQKRKRKKAKKAKGKLDEDEEKEMEPVEVEGVEKEEADDVEDVEGKDSEELCDSSEIMLQDAKDDLQRATSCPCLSTTKEDLADEVPSEEEVGCLWPATPESTPPQTPRTYQQPMMWVPMPVVVMPMMPIAAH